MVDPPVMRRLETKANIDYKGWGLKLQKKIKKNVILSPLLYESLVEINQFVKNENNYAEIVHNYISCVSTIITLSQVHTMIVCISLYSCLGYVLK